jgi:hypothetical protein
MPPLKFFRRMPPPEITPEVPIEEVDPLDEIFAEGEQFLGPGPAAEALKSHLGQLPNPEEFKPSIAKRGVSALAAALAGFGQNSATAGASLGLSMIEAPYRHALDQYTKKAKTLGDVADLEEGERKEKRLWASTRAGIVARKAEAEARRKQAEQKPSRQLKPEMEFDEKGYATGRVWDPDEMKMKFDPSVKGFRKGAESPALTQKKSNNQVARLKATELKTVYERMKEKYKGNKIFGNPHIGRGQGALSEMATDMGLINDPDVRNLHELARELSNERLYALSGAQINNKEFERLRRTMADPNKAEDAFPVDLDRFMRYLEAADNGLISINRIDPVTGIAESDWTPELSSANDTNDASTTDVSNPGTGTNPTQRKIPLRIRRRGGQ